MDPPKTGIKIFNPSAMKSATKKRPNDTTVCNIIIFKQSAL